MQTPEKLTLIGGSILLASTLVFTLKGQASHILPRVDGGMTNLFRSDKDRQVDQEQQKFDSNYQQAQQEHWQTGHWGTAKFYVDDQGNMHVGSGQLSGSFSNVVNDQQIQTISLDVPVQGPQDSTLLFADNEYSYIPLSRIEGLTNLDTSHVTNMGNMFDNDSALSSLNLSHFNTSNVDIMTAMFEGDSLLGNLNVNYFDTSNVTDMEDMFASDSSLRNLDLSHFDTSNVTNMADMFRSDNSLSSLDISHFNTSNTYEMDEMFFCDSSLHNLDLSHFDTSSVSIMDKMIAYEDSLSNLKLGPNTKLSNSAILNGTYKQDNQVLNLDGNAHPGTWIKQ